MPVLLLLLWLSDSGIRPWTPPWGAKGVPSEGRRERDNFGPQARNSGTNWPKVVMCIFLWLDFKKQMSSIGPILALKGQIFARFVRICPSKISFLPSHGSMTPVYVPGPHHEEPKVYRAEAGERGSSLFLWLEIPGQKNCNVHLPLARF